METIFGIPGCQPGLATSFQLVRLVGCGLKNFNRLGRLVTMLTPVGSVGKGHVGTEWMFHCVQNKQNETRAINLTLKFKADKNALK